MLTQKSGWPKTGDLCPQHTLALWIHPHLGRICYFPFIHTVHEKCQFTVDDSIFSQPFAPPSSHQIETK